MSVRVQREDFDPGAELARLTENRCDVGAVASFVGLVRGAGRVSAMTLEHYPGMTERQLAWAESETRRRWPVTDSVIIHRYGRLMPGERIMLVGVTSPHRAAAFAACEFLVDWLKTRAPFWKLEEGPGGQAWVAAKDDDARRAERWENGAKD
jgi:molybdopterin synthase catalytic subunit